MYDRYQRKIEYVRISLTDRCNLRCRYCMPENGVEKLRHEDILRFDEIVRIVRALASLGVRKVRLTGGEPLIRRNVVELVREIRSVPGIESVALTTNGVLLADMAEDLVQAGLTGVNISLDTLKAASFTELTRRPFFARVEDGIEAIAATGLRDVKFNCVPIAGVNEVELPELATLEVPLHRAHADWLRLRGGAQGTADGGGQEQPRGGVWPAAARPAGTRCARPCRLLPS